MAWAVGAPGADFSHLSQCHPSAVASRHRQADKDAASGRAMHRRILRPMQTLGALLGCVLGACALSASAAIAAPVLQSADLQITITSPTSCDVVVALTVDGVSEIEHRIEAFEGSRIELVGIRGARQVGDVRTIGVTQSLLLRPDQAAYGFHYRAVQSAPRQHRCPIWLPTVPTEGRSRTVRLQIDLPPAAVAGSSMPALTWTGAHGVATLGNLPAFVRVPYARAGEARQWAIGRVMDALAIAAFATAAAVWTWRLRQ
jgi:hypothetical protein